jgi:hypothetical protein
MGTVGGKYVVHHIAKLGPMNMSMLHHVCDAPLQCRVAKGTQFSIGTLASEKYFSHCLSQLKGSSPRNVGKSNFGLAIERLKLGLLSLLCSKDV